MKVLFWVPYPHEGASNRYRVEQYLPYLDKEKIDYKLHPFWNSKAYKILYKKRNYLSKLYYLVLGSFYRLIDLIFIFKYDIVFIHREAYPFGGALFENVLRLLKKPFIFDFDDAIFLPYSSDSNIFIERFRKINKIPKIIKMSRCVIVGNNYLAEFAKIYSSSVFVISTSIDTDKFTPIEKDYNKEVIIGWIGSLTTVSYLKMLKNVFIDLTKQYSNVRFHIIGGNFSIDSISNIYCKTWSIEEEIEDLKKIDIGIMSMPDNLWTKGKCGFKAIMYMSMGIPTVCSPVGVNNEIIDDGSNGFLANNNKEWTEKLSMLIESPSLRKKIGDQGRKTIEEKYSLKVNAPKFLKILKEIF